MRNKDFYKILGIDRKATPEQIRSAYRKLVRKYHPDISRESDAEEIFKEIGEAYETLKDPKKRARYDHLGRPKTAAYKSRASTAWKARCQRSGQRFAKGVKSRLSNVIDSVFARKWASEKTRKAKYWFVGKDHHAKIRIELVDAYLGANRRMTLRIPEPAGDGSVRTSERVLNIRIPKGVKEGQRIRLKGQGLRGPLGTRAGDLYLEVEFKADPFFSVKDSDVFVDLPTAPWEAALGATITIPTPGVPVEVQIPPGSRQGSRIRLKELGIPGSPNGHLYVTLQILLPPAQSEQEKNVYRDMARRLPFNPRSKFDERE